MDSDRLKQLTGQFLSRTREELVALRALMPAARAGQPEALLELHRVVHRVSGSGALLGFKVISEHARQIERILRRAEPGPDEAEWQMILSELQGIDTALSDATVADVAQ